jgi:hypothetical protein
MISVFYPYAKMAILYNEKWTKVECIVRNGKRETPWDDMHIGMLIQSAIQINGPYPNEILIRDEQSIKEIITKLNKMYTTISVGFNILELDFHCEKWTERYIQRKIGAINKRIRKGEIEVLKVYLSRVQWKDKLKSLVFDELGTIVGV